MNYKVIRANPDFGLGVGDVFKPSTLGFMQQYREGEPYETCTEALCNILHEAKYLEPFPDRKLLKLEVEFECEKGRWYCKFKGTTFAFGSGSLLTDYLDSLLAKREAGNG
jgi:hypothetical protein